MAEKTTVTTKELNPGIILHKHVTPMPPGDQFETVYEFKVEL